MSNPPAPVEPAEPVLHAFGQEAGAGQVHLRILATSDLHGHLRAYDYLADRPSDAVGLARTASLIATARGEAANSVLVDNGDYLQGSPMGDRLAARGLEPGAMHPVIAAMNALGYDAGTLGNHEFDFGAGFLEAVNAGAPHPVVCANLARRLGASPREDLLAVPPFAILEREVEDGAGAVHRLRLGVTGVLPPQVMVWNREHLEGRFIARDMGEAARAWVPALREAGADLVLALCHTGIAAASETAGMENAALALAAIPGIDAVVAGHQHRVFPGADFAGEGIDAAAGRLEGTPAVMPGAFGAHLGVIDLMLELTDGDWRVVRTEACTRPIAERGDHGVTALVRDAPAIIEATEAAHTATLRHIRAEIGRTTVALHSYFALVSVDPCRAVVAEAQRRALRPVLRGTAFADLPLLSAAAPFRAGGRAGPEAYTDVPAGPLSLRSLADLYPFPNPAQAVLVSGAELHEWLERAAGVFRRIERVAADQELIDPAFPAFNFDAIDGVSYAVDVTAPARYDREGVIAEPDAHRIVDLRFGGVAVAPRDRFVVATSSYRAGGGGAFPGADGTSIVATAPESIGDAVLRYVAQAGPLAPAIAGPWRVAPAGGARVLFDTGRGAAAHVEAVRARGLVIEPAGPGPRGFARYRLRL